MSTRGLIRGVVIVAMGFGGGALLAGEVVKTEPAHDKPQAAEGKATISADAQKIVDDAADAYGKLKSLELVGTFTGDFEAAGQKQGGTTSFTSSFEAPNKFRHAAKDEVIAGSTGENVFVYIQPKNIYLQVPASKEKVATKDLPKPLPRLMAMQNPSLMLAMAKDPGHELVEDATDVSKVDDTKISDVKLPTLKFTLKDKTSILLAFDPTTHLIRQTTADVKAQLESQGVPDVKKASYVIDYTTTTPDAAMKAEQFVWAPPAGAKDIKDMKAAAGGEEQPADALVGKEAPDFKLAGMDGKEVALSGLKGKVVVLDFWATWCPPCRASLPHLDKFYQENKAAGVQVFAVNQQEDKGKVQAFVDKTKLAVPVLLDLEGKTGGDYKANAIPETVVVGKDGKIVKVFVGFDADSMPEELKKVVEAAMKK
ncbi:MAG TPA: TlpA disulfide reductase family protein [Tepidisphaeraceae bacterium]|nr:TlpA disulfide reductase family protein [Tepidisphaeraceae bacterium]